MITFEEGKKEMFKKNKTDFMDNEILVFYDNWCPLCSRTVRFYECLDWFGRIVFLSCRDESILQKYNIDQEKAIRRMTAIRFKKKQSKSIKRSCVTYYEGIDTIILMSAQIPILWPFVPLLSLFRKIGMGVSVYDWIARQRKIIPIGQCETEVCLLNQDKNL